MSVAVRANYSVFAGVARMGGKIVIDGWMERARGGARGRLDVVRRASCVFICFFDGGGSGARKDRIADDNL